MSQKYFTYILKSLVNNDIYVGSTENVENRLCRHNSGNVKSTKAYRPWKLMATEEFGSRSEACKNEIFLKTGQQKELLRRRYG